MYYCIHNLIYLLFFNFKLFFKINLVNPGSKPIENKLCFFLSLTFGLILESVPISNLIKPLLFFKSIKRFFLAKNHSNSH